MSTTQLIIPDRINVGFQKRDDTYTKKLAYVIYFDKKGVLRKETSWQGWRDKKIPNVEFPNEPTEGFVLNKGVGGARQSYGWNARNEYIRVYDPRDFEFEISVANLLFILRECDCMKGKGLEGKFVYAWDKNNLILLPVNSQDYQSSKQYTELQSKRVSTKDLVPGQTYITKKQQVLVYLGKLDWHYRLEIKNYPKEYKSHGGLCYGHHRYDRYYADTPGTGVEKRHIFWSDEVHTVTDRYTHDQVEQKVGFVCLADTKSIASLQSDQVVGNFAEIMEDYLKFPPGTKISKLFLQKGAARKKNKWGHWTNENWFYEDDGVFYECSNQYRSWDSEEITSYSVVHSYKIRDGILVRERLNNPITVQPRHTEKSLADLSQANFYWREPTSDRLYAINEGGGRFKVNDDTLSKE